MLDVDAGAFDTVVDIWGNVVVERVVVAEVVDWKVAI